MGYAEAQCVSGARTVPHLLRMAKRKGIPVVFYGGRPKTLELMTATLASAYPKLTIVYCYSPPFRSLDAAEQHEQLERIADADVQLLFVALGSPKQERWMHEFSPSLTAFVWASAPPSSSSPERRCFRPCGCRSDPGWGVPRRRPSGLGRPYGQSKWEAEQSLEEIAAATGMDWLVVRPTLVYGPGVRGNFLSLLRCVHRGLHCRWAKCGTGEASSPCTT